MTPAQVTACNELWDRAKDFRPPAIDRVVLALADALDKQILEVARELVLPCAQHGPLHNERMRRLQQCVAGRVWLDAKIAEQSK